MKYPKKYKGIKEPIKFPVQFARNEWYACLLHTDNSYERKSSVYYEEEKHCWRTCVARNTRLGYSKKDVKKIIKKYFDVKKSKERKEVKAKKSKSKKK